MFPGQTRLRSQIPPPRERLNRSAWIATALLLLLFGAIAVWGFITGHRRYTQTGAALTVSPKDRDFGEVWSQPRFRWTLPVHNPTPKAVHVKKFATSCEPTAVHPETVVIPPGETRNVELTLDLRPNSTEESAALSGFEVNVEAQAGKASASWTVHGRVRRNPISVSAQTIDFGDDLIVGTPYEIREVTVSLPESGALSGLRAESVPSDAGVVQLEPLGDQPGRYRLIVAPHESQERGAFAFLIHLSARHESISPGPTREIAVRGVVRGPISAEPSRLTFGARPLGESAVDHVLLYSHDKRPFRADVVESDRGVRVQPAEGGRPGVQVFEVRQEYLERGDQTSSVTFEARYLDGEGEPPETVVVETYYYGLAVQTRATAESSR